MKNRFFRILLLLFVLIKAADCFAQSSKYFIENVKRIDDYLNGPIKANYCEGVIVSPQKYKLSKKKSDSFIVSFVNQVFEKGWTSIDIETKLNKIGKNKVVIVNESLNGLIETKEILLKGNYLWVRVVLGFIDNIIVRSKVQLKTTTHTKCGVDENWMIDFKIIKDLFIKDAKMLFNVEYDKMTSDTIYSDNLVSLAIKQSDYRFNIPSSSIEGWINEIFTKQYQADSAGAYSYTKAPKGFVMLIKENRTEVIKDLLFSPNYVTSVNAMEALLYLSAVNKVQLTAELNDRITQIKSESFIIMQQGAPDVFYTRKGYKELQTTDERVIKKYSSSM